ncbi:flagellin N-terminal helical domain-containing protein [Mobilicoccus pelagius]|uniref:Flagellin n=1 Tax=Mobilicoccus pelagius NBRC 104925 TaxID=1089455 RepID=H5UQW9_9MICO|nr:flagellin [Mobilicoccus pelagius]GAB48127.1 flagellin [Mobilicoccus pelagius NBRC 104925]
MGLQINTNVAALNAYRNLTGTQGAQQTSLERLSSGLRINRAADDAAGLAISENLRSQVNGLNQATSNAQDGISMVQTAEGAMNEVHSMLQRVRTLSVQAANGTNSASNREQIQAEIKQLGDEIGAIASRTNFNGTQLLKGGTMTLQVGAGKDDQLSFSLGSLDDVATAVKALDVTAADGAKTAIESIDTQIGAVSKSRSNLGAVQNRLEHTIKNLSVSAENLAASESRIRDTDMAKEMTSFTRSQILSQAGTAMLSQANQSTQGVLRLLG